MEPIVYGIGLGVFGPGPSMLYAVHLQVELILVSIRAPAELSAAICDNPQDIDRY